MALAIAYLLSSLACSHGPEIPRVEPEVVSPTLIERADLPGRPDADDPAIWIDRRHPERSLVLGTLKNAGMLVATLDGRIVQIIRPPNAMQGAFGEQDLPGRSRPCPESASGETFGRFNNVDVAYGLTLNHRAADLAVVSDRGCDRLRFYGIDPTADPPLTDLTSPEVDQVFPTRFVQPSPLQNSPYDAGWSDNPLDDEDTAYGLGLWQDGEELYAFVSQRNRGVVVQLRIEPAPGGMLGYSKLRTFRFDASFALSCEEAARNPRWTPCRGMAREDPQAEGLVVDAERRVLFVGIESVGVYRISLRADLPPVVNVGPDALLDTVRTFGHPYRAVPDGERFRCEYDPADEASADSIFAEGCPGSGGRHVVADVEGIAIYRGERGSGYVIVSSQGDSTFQVYERDGANRYVGAFRIAGVHETDGLEVTGVPLGARFPAGLLVVQTGRVPAGLISRVFRAIRDHETSRFALVRWDRVASVFDPPLVAMREPVFDRRSGAWSASVAPSSPGGDRTRGDTGESSLTGTPTSVGR